MTEFRVVEVARVLDADTATTKVGDDVPTLAANVTDAVVAVDRETREPVYAYLPLPAVAELRRALLGIRYGDYMVRANGVRNQSRTFGYGPRRPVYRREGCSPVSLAGEAPDEHDVVCRYADHLARMLADIDPRLAVAARDAASVVDPDWRLGESKLWTSGVINESAVLPYHRDRFNLNAWSAMPVLRRHMVGGHLHIPEYGAVLGCRDGWGVFFAGYDLLHGVTPMRLARPDGYRYSVVYYALKGMKDCFTAAMETKYARERRTERERDTARRLALGDRSVAR